MPLVCIHAPGIGLMNFLHLGALADTFRLILPDLPGHGESTPLPLPYTFSDLADVLDEFVRTLGHQKAIVLGYSLGASIAMEWCLRHPETIAGLVLVSGFSEVRDLYMHTRFLMAKAAVSLRAGALLARSTAASHLDDPAEQKRWIAYARKTDPATLRCMFDAGHRYACTDKLASIHQPTLLLFGEKDRQMHDYAKLMKERLPNSRLILVPRVKHQIVTRTPEAVDRYCREFFSETAVGQTESTRPPEQK
ncbi:alpha/beta hydrolase [Brevibacillus composti]|uniref:Alpha/beta hydrolase n=2 Tax=Brevibacillus composti TaxID=2796470 RepID=A0A7T5EQ01_9BACL|nr:alpha/beta hydrolase [Brevibacillus composti]QUO43712.1 alpha/beta hydrolase [Brevibacillus composti]